MKPASENQDNNASSFFVVVCATKTYLLSFLHVISISFIQLGFHFSTFLSNRPLQNSLDVAHKFNNLQW
jgi:hypothetical protein